MAHILHAGPSQAHSFNSASEDARFYVSIKGLWRYNYSEWHDLTLGSLHSPINPYIICTSTIHGHIDPSGNEQQTGREGISKCFSDVDTSFIEKILVICETIVDLSSNVSVDVIPKHCYEGDVVDRK